MLKKDPAYVDPTMTMPIPPHIPCRKHVEKDADESCYHCKDSADWNKTYCTHRGTTLYRTLPFPEHYSVPTGSDSRNSLNP